MLADQEILVGGGNAAHIHFLPDLLNRRTLVGSGEHIVTEQRVLTDPPRHFEVALPHEELLHQLLLSQGNFDLGCIRLAIVLLGHEGLGFPEDQGGSHEQEFRGDVEIHLLHELQGLQVLVGDL